jgi:hypothetical protein
MKGVRPGGIEVEISDTGRGFALETVPTERLGVRISIIERVTNSGGSVSIVSSPNHGAVVTVRWPLDRNVATDAVDESDEPDEPDEPDESADLDSLGDTDALDAIGSGSPTDGEVTK